MSAAFVPRPSGVASLTLQGKLHQYERHSRLDNVGSLFEVDEYLCTHLFQHPPLIVTRVDGNDVEAAVHGVLDRQGSQSSSCPGYSNPVTRLGVGVLEAAPNGEPRAKDWGCHGHV